MLHHHIMPALLLGACLVPLSATEEKAEQPMPFRHLFLPPPFSAMEEKAEQPDRSAYFQDLEAEAQAYKRVFDRFGREPVAQLRADILRDLPGYRSRGEFRAALQIFELTRDAEGVAKVFDSIPDSLRNDTKLFEELGWVSSDDRTLGRRAWLKALPAEYVYYGNVYDLLDDIRGKGPTADESMHLMGKLAQANPSIYFQYVRLLPNPGQEVERMVRSYPAADASEKAKIRARVFEMEWTPDKWKSQIALFHSLLDPEKQEDRDSWLQSAAALGEWQSGADFLIKHLHDEYSQAEIRAGQMYCSMPIDDTTLLQWAKTARYQQLVSFLLNAGRAQDAQKYAEEGFGKGVDAMRAVDVWMMLGAMQQSSGARTFEGMLQKAEPKADTWEYFNNRFAYYKGRKESEKAQEALQAAVDKGRETGNPGMVCTAYMAWGDYLKEKAGGLDPKVADDPRRADYLRAMECYEQAYETACEMDDSHKRAWCAGRIIDECKGTYSYHLYRAIIGAEQAEARLKKLYKAELAAGYPLAAGIPYAAEKTPVRIDDPVFSAITDPARCKGVGASGLADGLLLQLSYARADEVPPLLEKMARLLEERENMELQAVQDTEQKKQILARYPLGDTFCQSIIFARADMPWKAVAARYALQRYPDYNSPSFPNAAASLLAAALPALDLAEGRAWADRIWNRKAMSVEMRLSILQALQKKAAPDSPAYRQLARECEVLFGSTEKDGK